MTVACPQCRSKIPPDDVSLATALARCRSCNAVFDARENGAGARRRPETPLPRGWRLEDDGSRLLVEWRWFSAKAVVLLVACVAWNGFLAFWYSAAFGGGAPLIALLFPIIHVAVGVGLAYGTAASFLNRSIVMVSPHDLTVRHGPVPWRGNLSVPASDIAQLHCTEVRHRQKHGYTLSYTLHATAKDGRRIELARRLEQPEQALYLEQEIERHLHLSDRPVSGELPR